MHKSRLAGMIIDCQTEDLESAATFWSRALGLEIAPAPPDEESLYAILKTRPEDPYLEVQKVSHASRVHLDIESDDIEAEVRRLEGLGAKRIAAIKTWVVMEAPTGQRFCVIRAQSKNFDEEANRWT
jgi:predicted enzyme related to lactoylglutathione lyase